MSKETVGEQEVEALARILHDGLREEWERAQGQPIGEVYARWDDVNGLETGVLEDYRTEARAALRAGYRRMEEKAEDG